MKVQQDIIFPQKQEVESVPPVSNHCDSFLRRRRMLLLIVVPVLSICIAFICVFLIIRLIQSSKTPKLEVDSVILYPLHIPDSNLSTRWTFDFIIRNHQRSKDTNIYDLYAFFIKDVRSSILFQNQIISSTVFTGSKLFEVSQHFGIPMRMELVDRSAFQNDTAEFIVTEIEAHGTFTFTLKLTAYVVEFHYDTLMLPYRSYSISVSCEQLVSRKQLKVEISENVGNQTATLLIRPGPCITSFIKN